jgi:hypothetical protein
MSSQRNGTAVPVLLFVVMIVRLPGAGSLVEASHSAACSVPSAFTGKDRSCPVQSPLLNFAWYTRVSLEIVPAFTDADDADVVRVMISLNALVSWAGSVSALVTRK